MLALDVDIAVLTNVDLDHHVTYGSLVELEAAFATFLDGAAERVVAPDLQGLELRPGGSRFVAEGVEVELQVPGEHNARNAAAALAACRLAGAGTGEGAPALNQFRGAGRRFERLGHTATGALVIDDYAHHPTEIAATIAAARTPGPRR